MGNTGMYLLEDPDPQAFAVQSASYHPLGWHMVDTLQPMGAGNQSPAMSMNRVAVAPFPVVAPSMATNSPYAVGLQPRMPSGSSRRFTPINDVSGLANYLVNLSGNG